VKSQNKTNEQTKSRNRPKNTENNLMVARGEEVGEWAKQMKKSRRYKLLVME